MNTLAHFDFIMNKVPPQNLDTFILSGCSAGGLATYYWADYLRGMLLSKNDKLTFFGLPDSGFFIDYKSSETNDNSFKLKMQNMFTLTNTEVDMPNSDCVKAYPGN